AHALTLVGKPGARRLDHTGLDTKVDQLAAFRDAFAVHDVKVDNFERRSHLILYNLDTGLIANHLVSILDCPDTPDVEANRRIEFPCIATGWGLRLAEHYPDLETDLVDKNHHRARAGDRSGQLAQGLAHQPGL